MLLVVADRRYRGGHDEVKPEKRQLKGLGLHPEAFDRSEPEVLVESLSLLDETSLQLIEVTEPHTNTFGDISAESL